MTHDAIDDLIDEATHAAFNLIPDELVNAMSIDERSERLIQINDALTPIMFAIIPSVGG